MTLEAMQSKRMKNLRVIVVDDVSDSKDLLEMYLKQKNIKVKAVDSARNALKTIKDFQPDLIISDIYMPEEDGYWLIEQLNQLNASLRKKLPAIAITAAARDEDREKVIAAGYDDYLSKPFLFEDLNTTIAQVMKKNLSVTI